MKSYDKIYKDWRIWTLSLLIIIVLLWIFYGGDVEEFEGLNFLINNNKIPEVKKKRGRMTSKGEEHCRKILQEHFRREFPPVRNLDWLKNPETNRHLELDCYNKELGIALEYQGKQHYHYIPAFHQSLKDFFQQVLRDRTKKKLCEENKIWLIIVPYKISEKERKEFILNSLPERVGLGKNYSQLLF